MVNGRTGRTVSKERGSPSFLFPSFLQEDIMRQGEKVVPWSGRVALMSLSLKSPNAPQLLELLKRPIAILPGTEQR